MKNALNHSTDKNPLDTFVVLRMDEKEQKTRKESGLNKGNRESFHL